MKVLLSPKFRAQAFNLGMCSQLVMKVTLPLHLPLI